MTESVAEAAFMLVAFGVIGVAGVVGWIIGHNTGRSTTTVTVTASSGATTTSSSSSLGGGDPAAGKTVFASAGCAACHTLAAAGASGTVGPDLDQTKPSLTLALTRVREGAGAMPAFAGQLSEQEIKDVAAFVVASTTGQQP